ncbi:hypothetical protein RGQ29_026272 [Quercus rubra]|uniref:Uncharacterized protein n=1 Tax=Quercus rubra TaxID=3512 RepID=A0AAN7F088_QUERU|nr:hypothetical protein RGQ29_026272 [Quercus rubra]KAK4583472.1 hypothetical protein RGQ29_026272 [Quercus rubra]KAK4583473.1 hypothetical protein RGQ29_026272 [Quercus rubra]
MSKLGYLGTALRSNFSVKASHGIPASWLLRESPRRFSTEAEQPPQNSPIDPFLQNATDTGPVYGKIFGITKHTLKTDIINMLKGCNLTMDDVKVNYNWSFMPIGVMVQFPFRNAYDQAFRMIGRKGRLYRLERGDRSQWDLLMPYNGKTVLLQGLPRNALPEDVERFLTGCVYEASSIEMFMRGAFPDAIRMATVNFPSKNEAMNAFIKKNRGFCLNNQISVRVLQ